MLLTIRRLTLHCISSETSFGNYGLKQQHHLMQKCDSETLRTGCLLSMGLHHSIQTSGNHSSVQPQFVGHDSHMILPTIDNSSTRKLICTSDMVCPFVFTYNVHSYS